MDLGSVRIERRRIRAVGLALACSAGVSACGGGPPSIDLIFPNESARLATVRILVQTFSPGTGADERDCSSFLGRSDDDRPMLDPTASGDYNYPFDSDQELANIPKGRQLVFVQGFASRNEGSTAILEGCSDKFDSEGGSDKRVKVPVELSVIVASDARLTKVAGDRQVGRAGQTLPVKLKVALLANESATPHLIPGVLIRFESKTKGFHLKNGPSDQTFEALTDAKGEAEVDVETPSSVGAGVVEAAAVELEPSSSDRTRFRQTFEISTTEEVRLPTSRTIASSGEKPIAVALGRVSGGSTLDVVVLSCQGSQEECDPAPPSTGVASMVRPGATRLAVYADLTGAAERIPVADASALGIGPAGLVVTDLAPDQGTDDIAVLNRRRADCASRVCDNPDTCSCYGARAGEPCPCEGSEVLILSDRGGSIRLEQRATLTASNAVSLIAYTADSGPYRNLAAAGAGRAVNNRPCGRTGGVCLPYDLPMCRTHPEECGCPPMESCECSDCVSQSQPGVCTAQDRFVDLLVNRWNQQTGAGTCSPGSPNGACPSSDQICERGYCVGRINNAYGCQEAQLTCNALLKQSTCGCEGGSSNECKASDNCGCSVPYHIFIGGFQNPRRPFSIAAGPATDPLAWDLVAATDGGLELIRSKAAPQSFEWDKTPKVNAPIHGVSLASFDSDPAADVVWFSKKACLDGFEDTCPFFQKPDESAKPKGCLGLFYTDGQPSIFQLRTPSRGGCRRYSLDFSPAAMCTGRFNRDAYVDVALSGDDASSVYVFTGDGRGGLRSDPDVLALPAGAKGGALACGDVDGDGVDDVVVLSHATGEVFVLRSGP